VIIQVDEYYGNNFCGSKKAKYFEATRTIEYFPEPEYEDFEEDETTVELEEDDENEYE
jgi:hypothetical protein